MPTHQSSFIVFSGAYAQVSVFSLSFNSTLFLRTWSDNTSCKNKTGSKWCINKHSTFATELGVASPMCVWVEELVPNRTGRAAFLALLQRSWQPIKSLRGRERQRQRHNGQDHATASDGRVFCTYRGSVASQGVWGAHRHLNRALKTSGCLKIAIVTHFWFAKTFPKKPELLRGSIYTEWCKPVILPSQQDWSARWIYCACLFQWGARDRWADGQPPLTVSENCILQCYIWLKGYWLLPPQSKNAGTLC